MRARVLRSTPLWLLLAMPVGAQQPGPEHEKLAVMAGNWEMVVEIPAGVAGAAAVTVTGTEECAWFAQFHIVCRNEAKTTTGPYTAIRIVSFQPEIKQYTVYTVDSLGLALLATGQVSGAVWTFSAEASGTKSRLVITMGADGYTGATEVAGRDGKWTTMSTVKAKKMP